MRWADAWRHCFRKRAHIYLDHNSIRHNRLRGISRNKMIWRLFLIYLCRYRKLTIITTCPDNNSGTRITQTDRSLLRRRHPSDKRRTGNLGDLSFPLDVQVTFEQQPIRKLSSGDASLFTTQQPQRQTISNQGIWNEDWCFIINGAIQLEQSYETTMCGN